MKELEKEIESVEQLIRKLEDEKWQKMVIQNASMEEVEDYTKTLFRWQEYLKGLNVAKMFIEMGASDNGENKYVYTIVEDGETKSVDRIETEEEMHERVKCYRRNNIKVKKVVKECTSTMWIDVNF